MQIFVANSLTGLFLIMISTISCSSLVNDKVNNNLKNRFQQITRTSIITDTAKQALKKAIPIAETDPNRPVYHFRPPAQWMNDPAGAIYHNGQYHLFYQFGPTSDQLTPHIEMYWAHARSRDLVSWEDLPVALWASRDLGERRCNSGSVMTNPKGQPMAFYTSVPIMSNKARQQWAAVAEDDDLINWKKHPSNPLLSLETHGGPRFGNGWGDTVIFQTNNRTFMILGAELGEDVVLPIYETTDSDWTDWKYKGLLFRLPKTSLKDLETPSFFPMGKQWVFLCSPGGQVQYFIGSFNLETLTFHPVNRGTLDHSYGDQWPSLSKEELSKTRWPSLNSPRGFYANHTLINKDGQIILLGWVSGFKLGRGWNGCLALPRIFSLGSDGLPRQQPVPALKKLRGSHTNLKQLKLQDQIHVVGEASGDTLEILVRINPGTAKSVGVNVRRSKSGNEGVPISYNRQQLSVAGTKIPFQLKSHEEILELQIFLDKSVMEVFVNGGREVFTRVIYPGEKDLGIELFASGGDALVESLDVWQMSSIW